ncbi:MAG: replication-relaxation family protein [Caulobacterales bacterium]
MKTDALSRRLRFAPPKPVVRRLVLTEPDYVLFEAIDRHGPLPTHYLYEFTKHVRRDYTHLQNRLTEFYNGSSERPYLVRPPQQFAGYEARYQHIVYDLAPRAKHALAERGTLARHSPRRSDPFLHRLMSACVAASIDRSAARKGLRYISREEILTHPRCPETTRTASNPLAIPLGRHGARNMVPDDLFGLEYAGAGFRFFAVEIDRNTESIERKNFDQIAFAKKIVGYLDILRNQTYRAWWGVPNLHVLTVTTNATHAHNILDYIRRQNEPQYAGRFGFACEPSFGANWRVPRAVLSNLLEGPWMTVVASKDISRP